MGVRNVSELSLLAGPHLQDHHVGPPTQAALIHLLTAFQALLADLNHLLIKILSKYTI